MAASPEYSLVTGAASGIGEAIVRVLLACGQTFVGMDLNAERLTGMVSEFKDRFIPITADGTSEVDVVSAFREAQQRDRLKSAFDVVGGARFAPLVDHALEDWTFTTALTFNSTFPCLREEARIMENGGGSIVNLASLNARIPAHCAAAYSATKAAVKMLTKNAPLELARFGIWVNVVLPGLTVTPSTEKSVLPKLGLVAKFLVRIPLRRTGEAWEIAKPSVFLASDAASYITGASLLIDGAWATTTYPDLSK